MSKPLKKRLRCGRKEKVVTGPPITVFFRVGVEAMSKPPEWFGKSLAAVQHQDTINSWPWLYRCLHRMLIARRCPACLYWNAKGKT